MPVLIASRTFGFVALVLAALPLCALDPNRAITQYAHDSWHPEQGLPENGARSIVQAPDGHLWIGTSLGVARFDGVHFTAFNHLNTAAFPGKDVPALLADADGTIWAGTDSGLAKYANSEWTVYDQRHGLASPWIQTIFRDSLGDLFVGMRGGGLSKFDHGRFVTVPMGEGTGRRSVSAILEDRDGALWLATGHGLRWLRNGAVRVYLPEDGLPVLVCTSLNLDPDGSLWVGTYGGLSHFAGGKFTNYTVKDGLSGNLVSRLARDRDGNLWVGTNGYGLNRFRDGRIERLGEREGLPGRAVFGLYEDRERSLWIGTIGAGLHRLQDGKSTPFGPPEGLLGKYVTSVAATSAGALWVTTEAGISFVEQGKVSAAIANEQLGGFAAYGVMVDRKDRLWIAVADGTVRRREGGRERKFTLNSGSPTPAAFLHEDLDGNVWAGTGAGVVRISTSGMVERFRRPGAPVQDVIENIIDDPRGGLLMATYSGIDRWENGRFTEHYSTRDGLPSDMVYLIFLDREGTLWATTSKGLSRMKDGRFISVSSADGSELMQDKSGRFWMGSIAGPFSFTKEEFDRAAAGRSPFAPVRFNTGDGMRAAECNTAGAKTPDGMIWFGTHEGLARFDPSHLNINRQPPPIAIEALLANDRAVSGAGPALAAGTQRVEFRYAGLSFLAPAKVRFRYRLEGQDPDWLDAGSRREAFYTNLGPGRYRFRVKASNNDGIWNESDASLAFFVLPHYYQTWWFFALCALAAVLVGTLLYRMRIRQIEDRYAMVLTERTRIARELHDTLLQSFSGLALHIQAAANKIAISPEAGRKQLHSILNQIENCLAEARQAVWDIRTLGCPGEDLHETLSSLGQRIAATAGVPVETKVSGHPVPLPESTAQQLIRIAQEAIRNAARHAKASNISVLLNYQPEAVQLTVADDGCGFEVATAPGPAAGHFGLSGLAERASGIGGRLDLNSAPGQGTRVHLTIPSKGAKNGA